MKKYKILHVYNQCVNTTIPLQSFNYIKDKNFLKLVISWNQKNDDKDIKYFEKNSDIIFKGLDYKNQNIFYVIKEFIKYLKKENIDLIHVHHSYSAFFSSLIGRILNKKIIVTIHSDYRKYSFTNKFLFFFSMLFSNKIIANSNNTLLSIPYVFRSKTIIIYNGVELEKIINFQKKKNKKEFIICTVARLVKLKNIETLIKAFKLLSDKYYRDILKLYIIGDGPEKDNLQKLVKKYKLENKIYFTGKIYREEVYNLLKEADIFCSTSKWEGFGNAIVEAMAAELPIVSSKIPVVEEIIGLENALYFEVGNYQELFLQLEKLYLNKELRNKLAHKVFERAQLFSIEKNAEEHVKLYKNLLKGNK